MQNKKKSVIFHDIYFCFDDVENDQCGACVKKGFFKVNENLVNTCFILDVSRRTPVKITPRLIIEPRKRHLFTNKSFA